MIFLGSNSDSKERYTLLVCCRKQIMSAAPFRVTSNPINPTWAARKKIQHNPTRSICGPGLGQNVWPTTKLGACTGQNFLTPNPTQPNLKYTQKIGFNLTWPKPDPIQPNHMSSHARVKEKTPDFILTRSDKWSGLNSPMNLDANDVRNTVVQKKFETDCLAGLW